MEGSDQIDGSPSFYVLAKGSMLLLFPHLPPPLWVCCFASFLASRKFSVALKLLNKLCMQGRTQEELIKCEAGLYIFLDKALLRNT